MTGLLFICNAYRSLYTLECIEDFVKKETETYYASSLENALSYISKHSKIDTLLIGDEFSYHNKRVVFYEDFIATLAEILSTAENKNIKIEKVGFLIDLNNYYKNSENYTHLMFVDYCKKNNITLIDINQCNIINDFIKFIES